MRVLAAAPADAGIASARTTDGGARQPDADLWCSYAAVRCLAWLGRRPADADAVAAFLLSRQNADGAFAWQRGMASDMWATYYCTQALRDLGRDVPATERLARWTERLRTGSGGFAMTPGQSADVWATYYACRTYAEVLGRPVPDVAGLERWLRAAQHEAGGLSWAPGGAEPDVRACYYGAVAWRAAAGDRRPPWRTGALVAWLRGQQAADGGFGFATGSASCSWAAFRAVRALDALGAQPRDAAALRAWLERRRLDGGGYERWAGYGQADVWACFTVVGALATLGVDALVPAQREAVAAFVQGCQLTGSGFTYRDPDAAGDSLATAAGLLLAAERRHDPRPLAAWLRAAQLPFEDGVMYMPGRGAEVRCTLWAAAALNTVGESLDDARLATWLGQLQNPDGGFGYWLGRGSDVVSTVSALETAHTAGLALHATLDTAAARSFLDTCASDDGYGPAPGAATTLSATAQAARALDLLGDRAAALAAASGLARCASLLGGYSARPRALPELVSTYQAVLTAQVLGLPVDRAGLARFMTKVAAGAGFAWSPVGSTPGGPLADCLGALLGAAATDPDAALPRLNL